MNLITSLYHSQHKATVKQSLIVVCEHQYCLVQVRLKKEILDESARGSSKQRNLLPGGLTGDQWYVQQASRWACCPLPHPSWSVTHTNVSYLLVHGQKSYLYLSHGG